jgi:hypothetical protein
MSLRELQPHFKGVIKAQFCEEQVAELYELFKRDFIDGEVVVSGVSIKIDMFKPKIKQYEAYPETFRHLITRKNQTHNTRLYECERADRIHWIKPILESHPCDDILYYKWTGSDNVCKEHFWYFAKDFMVIIKTVEPNLRIVTAFCVDETQKLTYYERYKKHVESLNDDNEKTHPVGA